MKHSCMYSPSRMVTTHDIGKRSFCVSKTEVDHRLLGLMVGRNLKTTLPTFLLFTSLPQTATTLGIDVRESQDLSETSVLDGTTGYERQNLRGTSWPKKRNSILRFKVTEPQRYFQNSD